MAPLPPLSGPWTTHQRTTVLVVLALILYTSYRLVALCILDSASLHASSRPSSSPLIEFHVHPSLLPPPFPPSSVDLPELKLDLPPGTQIPSAWWPNVVPPIVHYIVSLSPSPSPGPELKYFQYLAIRSALINLRPKLLLIHHPPGRPPHGAWFDLLAPYVTLSPVDPPEEVFGRPLTHYAHKADVIRLQLLLQLGGVYLDQDTFILRPFDQAGLFTQDVVMAMEANPYAEEWEWEPGGLCNGIVVARPGADFVKRWLGGYRTFNESGREWAEHSVALPWELALTYPSEVTILNSRAMFYPLWSDSQLKLVHEPSSPGPKGGGWDFSDSKQLAYHAWESVSMPYLDRITPSAVGRGATSFTRMLQSFVGAEDRRVEQQIALAQKRQGS